MDAREAAIALASFMTPEQTARLAGRGAAPRLANIEISEHELGGPPSPTPGELDAVAEIEADVGERCAVGLVHRAERGAVPAR
ncbi:hypothetical protein [Sorangium sp. So ce124]|uniref:hypothetical protein n=1 Tax=Sorangium sp. So ce124 TaxID=3133280 RepID=UPI003F63B8BC